MRHVRVVAVLALVSACAGTTSSTPHTRLTAKDIVQRASPAIVRIEAGAEKIGTGFILDKTGVVATNLHVVEGEANIKVKMVDGTQYPVTSIAGIDRGHDLALLRITAQKPLPVLRLGDSSAVAAGDQVIAIGNPLGVFDHSVSAGLISQVRPLCTDADVAARTQLVAKIGRPADEIREEIEKKPRHTDEEDQLLRVLGCAQELTILQISAAISPGSSGGPLFNQYGEVIGVTTAIITQGQNINLAVPGNYLRPMLAQQTTIELGRFAKETRDVEEPAKPHADEDVDPKTGSVDTSVPPRQIPQLAPTTWDGCKPADIDATVQAISSAIEIGAPAYNKMSAQGFEECFRIYEGTSLRLEHDGACKGVRGAFGDGLLRASALTSFKDKAWALRDTFDGLLRVAAMWCAQDEKACRASAPMVHHMISGP